MRLIVGLGNPGARFRDTPHNAGFRVCDEFAERHHLGDEVRKFEGLLRRGHALSQDVGVLKPLTYMNLSGKSVADAIRYLPAEGRDLIVVFDDMDLPAGRLRIRPDGGHGGHGGVRSLIEALGMRDFPRIRVGVGRPPEGRDPTGHLLSRVPYDERAGFQDSIERAVAALEVILEHGVDEAMNRYNGPPLAGNDEEEGKE